jgi:hypothetical protein
MTKPKKKAVLQLYRGDHAQSVALPDPKASPKIVAHILYLGGMGRPTPFTSTSDSKQAAAHFARPRGKVWQTDEPTARGNGARYVSKKDLLHLLHGYGKGRAGWPNAIEVASARAFVLMWSEHLLDWSGHGAIQSAIVSTFR